MTVLSTSRTAPLKSFLGFCLILLFLTVVYAEAAKPGGEVSEKTLSNGLKVILLENHKAPVVTFQVWYRAGSRNEAWGKTGISHVLEHMMFKGTEKVSGPEFTRMIAINGGNLNAFTSQDFAAYFENIASDRVEIPIRLEADRMRNLVLRLEDFKTERNVVLEERRMRTVDDPQTYLMEQVQATVYQTSPYHWPVIGWEQDLRDLTLPDLAAYYDLHYSPVNAFIVVVGDFSTGQILPVLEKAFGGIPRGIQPAQDKKIDPPQTGERRVVAKREAELPFLLMTYHVPNLRDPDSYVLEVIAAMLSEGKSSRLYRRLVQEKELAVAVAAENSLLSRDPATFTVAAQLLPGRKAEEVEATFDHEIELLHTGPIGPRELQKAKNQLEADFVYAQQSIFGQAMLLAQHEIALEWRKIDDYVPRIREVSADDIQRVARLYLVRHNRTVGTLVPLPPEGSSKPVRTFPPQNRPMIR